MSSEQRLIEYIENDKAYQKYKSNKIFETDFERFCFVHCQDIEWVLGEIKHLRELQKSMDKQHEELENNWNKLKKHISSEWYCFDNESIEYEVANDILSKMQEIESDKNE